MCLKRPFRAAVSALLAISAFTYADEHSIPAPTQLAEIASIDGARLAREQHLQTITSQSASARIKSISVVGPDGRTLDGIEIDLSKTGDRHKLYLEDALLPGLLEELSKLEPIYPCKAGKYCTIGIERCGGRNAAPQAYCVGYNYGSSEMPDGLVIWVPDQHFMFPGVEPEAFVRVVRQYKEYADGT